MLRPSRPQASEYVSDRTQGASVRSWSSIQKARDSRMLAAGAQAPLGVTGRLLLRTCQRMPIDYRRELIVIPGLTSGALCSHSEGIYETEDACTSEYSRMDR